ncbi:hypothetical protein D3C87_931670 [compost metagenome]
MITKLIIGDIVKRNNGDIYYLWQENELFYVRRLTKNLKFHKSTNTAYVVDLESMEIEEYIKRDVSIEEVLP